MASALARFSGGTSDAPVAVAVGLNMAAPSPAISRLARTSSMVGAIAVTRLPTMNTARPTISRRLRGQCAAVAAITGESSA
ncbi:hypothetical protein AYR66_15940 [Noviherbaspirillum denitrificans]|uniref:Uncharacterized protein n=1 Tax=Noviherbaspirillum denitrificans TaxID=1968433 RepID=A0A254TF10_9BURK|nr:hypothetical protein AYR66_15940 [Noviherbaspirillum denitrificans]